MTDEPRIKDREIIKRALVFALRHRSGIKWPRDTDRETESAADRILDHLELSNVRMKMGKPVPGHSNKSGAPT